MIDKRVGDMGNFYLKRDTAGVHSLVSHVHLNLARLRKCI